ncbi:MAG TPA: hypothetical protein VMW79_08060, partial [Anaerolineae bacterium]|nr:hypothetical protein [Anaerolineae bacterium]
MEYDTELVKKVKVMVGQGRGDHVIADNLGITRHMARRIMQYLKGSPIEPHLQSIEETDSTMQASAVCQARSLEALLDMLDVDLNAWYVERWVGNQWGDGSMWQIKA